MVAITGGKMAPFPGGVVVKNGAIKNPIIVFGVHNFVYKCDAK